MSRPIASTAHLDVTAPAAIASSSPFSFFSPLDPHPSHPSSPSSPSPSLPTPTASALMLHEADITSSSAVRLSVTPVSVPVHRRANHLHRHHTADITSSASTSSTPTRRCSFTPTAAAAAAPPAAPAAAAPVPTTQVPFSVTNTPLRTRLPTSHSHSQSHGRRRDAAAASLRNAPPAKRRRTANGNKSSSSPWLSLYSLIGLSFLSGATDEDEEEGPATTEADGCVTPSRDSASSSCTSRCSADVSTLADACSNISLSSADDCAMSVSQLSQLQPQQKGRQKPCDAEGNDADCGGEQAVFSVRTVTVPINEDDDGDDGAKKSTPCTTTNTTKAKAKANATGKTMEITTTSVNLLLPTAAQASLLSPSLASLSPLTPSSFSSVLSPTTRAGTEGSPFSSSSSPSSSLFSPASTPTRQQHQTETTQAMPMRAKEERALSYAMHHRLARLQTRLTDATRAVDQSVRELHLLHGGGSASAKGKGRGGKDEEHERIKQSYVKRLQTQESARAAVRVLKHEMDRRRQRMQLRLEVDLDMDKHMDKHMCMDMCMDIDSSPMGRRAPEGGV